MGDHLNVGQRDEHKKMNERRGDRSINQHQPVSSNPAVQLQAAVGNRALLKMLKNGALSGATKAKSPGHKIPGDLRVQMEHAFGADFSDVTVNESPHVKAMGAHAFTQQNRVSFAPGKFTPASREGQSLLGHELAHVIQQRQGRVARPKDQNSPVVFNPALEQEANQSGERASRGLPVSGSLAMQVGPSTSPQFDSGAPVQGALKSGAEEEEIMDQEAPEEEEEAEE